MGGVLGCGKCVAALLGVMCISPEKLTWVLDNLITNGAKYSLGLSEYLRKHWNSVLGVAFILTQSVFECISGAVVFSPDQ